MRNRCLSLAFVKILMALTVVGFLTGAGPIFAAEIVVGQVGPMSGPEAGQGRAYAAGMQLHFTAMNKAGGINGHKFTLLRKDDGGVPNDTVTLTRQMMAEDKPLVLAGYFGGKNVADLVSAGVLAKEKIALVGYRTSEIQPDAPYLYGVRAGLRDEISKLIEHLATIGIKRLGLFHEAGPGSTAAIAAAEDAARKVKATIEGRASYVANTVNVTDAVDTFINMQPQAIIMISSGAAAAGFIEKYRIAGGAAQLLAHSGADIEQLSKRLSPEQMQGVTIAQVTPSPYKVSSQLVKEFTDTAARTRNLEVPVSYAMMEGYIAARVISEAIRRQSGRPSREGTVLALDSMSSFDLGGYVISFKPGQHSGSSFVELSIVTSTGRIRQ
ncbi:ABC-type branched-chain amino acid transport system, periplasmic component [Polaromonas sp. CF318]|uniref:ABC transporter substrate-binding protein n=1 Tax=Polaromonas sp. CF318 TaxID=1144318 RepID=UPI000270F935|nr:ABC transporter substrate-binding protein [Polaromonas sp. CF318]EJL89021.1 ABC-type branched-chain amino acid transport system, periplasmic component [Polaromonas sp. CF318]